MSEEVTLDRLLESAIKKGREADIFEALEMLEAARGGAPAFEQPVAAAKALVVSRLRPWLREDAGPAPEHVLYRCMADLAEAGCRRGKTDLLRALALQSAGKPEEAARLIGACVGEMGKDALRYLAVGDVELYDTAEKAARMIWDVVDRLGRDTNRQVDISAVFDAHREIGRPGIAVGTGRVEIEFVDDRHGFHPGSAAGPLGDSRSSFSHCFRF